MKAHEFTAIIALAPGLDPVENKTGKGWSTQWLANRQVRLTFMSTTAPAALMRLHFVAQRLMRGVKVGKGPARRYLPTDYTVASMRSQTGDYDLPRGKNPDLSTVEARREWLDGERTRTEERYGDVDVGEIRETQAMMRI